MSEGIRGTGPVARPRPISSFPDLLRPWALVDGATWNLSQAADPEVRDVATLPARPTTKAA